MASETVAAVSQPPPLRSPAEVDPRTALLLVPGGDGSDGRSGYAVPRGPALLAVTSSFLPTLCGEDDNPSAAIVVPCSGASRLAVRLAAWYIAHYATHVADRPHAPWLLPRPFEEEASAVPRYTSVFEQAVFGCIQRAGAAVACQVLHVAALLQAPGLGLLAGLALHLGTSSVEEALSALSLPTESSGPHVDVDAESVAVSSVDTSSAGAMPRCLAVELPDMVAVDANPQGSLTPSDVAALPTSVRSFYLPFVPGVSVEVTVPPSAGDARSDVVLAAAALLRLATATPAHVRHVTWSLTCDGQSSVDAVASAHAMCTFGQTRPDCWAWGAGCHALLDVNEMSGAFPAIGWAVVVKAADPSVLIDLPLNADVWRYVSTAESLDLRRLELTALPAFGFHGSYMRLPPSIESLGPAAFSKCRLASLDLSHCTGLTTIPDDCFAHASRRTKVLFPATIKTIGRGAFWSCGTSIDLRDCGALTHIGASAFKHFHGAELWLPDSIETIGDAAFAWCQCSASGADLSRSTNRATPPEESVLDLSHCKSMTVVPAEAFEYVQATEVRLPPSIVSVGERAFRGCKAAVDLSECSNLTTLPKECFARAKCAVHLPSSITSVGEFAFRDYKTALDLSTCLNMTQVNDSAFASFMGSSLLLPPSITSIGAAAFSCLRACDVDCPRGSPFVLDLSRCNLTVIPTEAFESIRATEVRLPPSVVSVGRRAFSGCEAAVDLSVCVGLTNIGVEAFQRFRGPALRFPPSLRDVGESAFAYCKEPKPSNGVPPLTLDFSRCKDMWSISGSCFSNSTFTVVVLPPTLWSLRSGAFECCTASIDFTRCSIRDIEEEAFSSFDGSVLDLAHCTDLVTIPDDCFRDARCTIRLPPTIRSVGWRAFMDCEPAVDRMHCTRLTLDLGCEDGSWKDYEYEYPDHDCVTSESDADEGWSESTGWLF